MTKQKKIQKNKRRNDIKKQQSRKEKAETTMNQWGKVNFFMLALLFAYIIGRDTGIFDSSNLFSIIKTLAEFVFSAFVQVVLESLLAKVVNAK